jgi:hypothetical protein
LALTSTSTLHGNQSNMTMVLLSTRPFKSFVDSVRWAISVVSRVFRALLIIPTVGIWRHDHRVPKRWDSDLRFFGARLFRVHMIHCCWPHIHFPASSYTMSCVGRDRKPFPVARPLSRGVRGQIRCGARSQSLCYTDLPVAVDPGMTGLAPRSRVTLTLQPGSEYRG